MARNRRSSSSTKFVDFHNMKLLPKNKPKKYRAGPLARRRLLVYFNDHAPHVLQCQSSEEYKNFLDACDAPKHFSERLRGTLGGYEHEHGVSWFDSDDYHKFAEEYEVLQEMVVKMVGEGEINEHQLDFFKKWTDAHGFRSTSHPLPMDDPDENGNYKVGGGRWTQFERPDPNHLWHGLLMSDIGWKVRNMIASTMQGNFIFNLCEYCRKGICEPETRFCRISCRTQHHSMVSKTA